MGLHPICTCRAGLQVRPLIVTGDAAQRGQYVGRACGMVAEAADLLLADVDTSGDVVWTAMGASSQDDKLLQTLTTAQVIPFRQGKKQS